MASIPKGGCQICRAVVKIGQNVKKNVKLYVFLAVILIEFLSIKLQNYTTPEFYAEKLYPFLSTLVLFLIIFAIYQYSEKLRFCQRQKLILIFLMFYYFINMLFIIVPICWSDYQNLINYSILCVLSILFIATWRNI